MTRDHAVVVLAASIAIVEIRTSQIVRLELTHIEDIAVIGDEVWIAAGEPLVLSRYRLVDGVQVGGPTPLWGTGVLVPTTLGTPGALWTAPPPAMITADSVVPIPGEWDYVLPITGSRWLTCRRDGVAMRDPTTERWAVKVLVGTGRIIDGAVLFDGLSAAFVVAQAGAINQLIVLNLHSGAVQHRVTLTGIDFVRFAPARGYALFCSGARLMYFDLRFGRVLKEHVEPEPVLDAALDAAGQNFVIRHVRDGEEVVFRAVADLLGGRQQERESTPNYDVIAPEVGLQTPEPPDAPTPDFHRGLATLSAFAALAPRQKVQRVSQAQALMLLECNGQLVSALVVRAIASGWDTGRIGFPNEGALPFRNEVSGILGETTGRAHDEVVTADRRVALATIAVREAEATLGDQVSPIATFASELGLSSTAQLLMQLIAGPSLWGELARLYAILSNDEERPMVDEMLLVQILSGQLDRVTIARELDHDAPLIRHGLVRTGDGRRPFLPLSCDPIVLRILQGDQQLTLDEIEVVTATRSFEDLLIPAATKDEIVRSLAGATLPGRIAIRGRTGAGRHTLLATLAAAANRPLAVIDTKQMMNQLPTRIGMLRTALRRANLLGMLPCVDGLEMLAADDRVGRDLIMGVLDEHPGPLATRMPWDAQPLLAPGHVSIDLPPPSLHQRTACWDEVLKSHGLLVREVNTLADRFGIGPGVIHRVCSQVASAAGLPTKASDSDADADSPSPAVDRTDELDGAIRQHLETGLHATATHVQKLASWSRVVLPADVQDSVLELIARIKHRRTVYDLWGYDQLLTTARGVTALFQGGPGTGKTLVASAIANELGMDLYRVDLSRIMSKWIGETEQNLAKLFDAAEDGHSIILFDEADSLFAKRTEVRSSVDRYANLEVNYLLQRLDSFEGIAILTTNFGTSIDAAFKRRLSFRLTFPFPDEEAREALWKAHVSPGIPKAGSFDLADLSRRYRLSGGYIRNAAIRAAFLAAEEQSPLTQGHLERAIQAEFREIGKIAESGVLE